MTREEARAGWVEQQCDITYPDGTRMRVIMPEAPPGTKVRMDNWKLHVQFPYPPPREAGEIQMEIVPYDKKYQN